MAQEKTPVRNIASVKKVTFKSIFMQWEWMLVAVLLIINLVNMSLSPNYLNYDNLMNAMMVFLDKAIMAFPMMMVLLLGEIDISVASIAALSGVFMGLANEAGLPFAVIVLVGLCAGALCGFMNGVLCTRFPELSSTIVTLGNLIFLRGLAYMILENKAFSGFPKQMKFFAWGKIGNIPFILIFFILEAGAFAFLIHRTRFGRKLYAMGNSEVASRFSGLKTNSIKVAVFTLSGLSAGAAALFLTSKLGSVRASMATGYEMEVIAMVVLGGVSSSGGKGRVSGVVLAVFTIGLLRFGLGLANISSQVIMIILGALLIVAVAIPNMKQVVSESEILKQIRRKSSRNPVKKYRRNEK